jgi:C2 domain
MSVAQAAKWGQDRGSKGGSSDVRPYPCPDVHLLELTVISAQDLYPQFKKMKTYAVATVYQYPNEELITQTDISGGTDPTWNDKFVLRVDGSFLRSETSTIDVTIFAVRKWVFGNKDYPLGKLCLYLLLFFFLKVIIVNVF